MMVRDKIYDGVKATVSGVVGAGWKVVSSAISAVRPKIEDGIRKGIEPVVNAQTQIVDKIKEKVMDKVQPVLKDVVAPRLTKVLEAASRPIFDGYKETVVLFLRDVDHYSNNAGSAIGDLKSVMKPMYYNSRSYWNVWPAYAKVRSLYDPLSTLGEMVEHVDAWALIDTIERDYHKILEKAFYTFEDDLRKQTAENPSLPPVEAIAAARARTLEKFQGDLIDATQGQLVKIMLAILLPPVQQKVTEPCSALLLPLEDLIPSPVKDFLSVQGMFDDLVTGLVTDSVTVVTEPAIEKFKDSL
jgi:hypothetical protein